MRDYSNHTPLPRIPPLPGRVGLEFRLKRLLLNPEVVMANQQDRIFPSETSTAGYAVFDLSGSTCSTETRRTSISFNFFNVGDTVSEPSVVYREVRSENGPRIAGDLYAAVLL